MKLSRTSVSLAIVIRAAAVYEALGGSLMHDAVKLLAALQRESAEVNDLNGVVAFCAGVFAEIRRCSTLEQAKTCAEMGAQALEERHRGLWSPGPYDDPADWRERRT